MPSASSAGEKRACKSTQASDLCDGAETEIEAQDSIDAVAAHHGRMERVPRRHAMFEPTMMMPPSAAAAVSVGSGRGYGPMALCHCTRRGFAVQTALLNGTMNPHSMTAAFPASSNPVSSRAPACANIRNAPNRRPTDEVLGAS